VAVGLLAGLRIAYPWVGSVPFVRTCGCNGWAHEREAATVRRATGQPVELEPKARPGERAMSAVCQIDRADGQRHR
jgi:hypothetical protein